MSLPAELPVLCVDIGGTSTKVATVTRDGNVEFAESIPTRPDRSSYINALLDLIRRVRTSAKEKWQRDFNQLGVAIAGFLDEERNYFIYNSNIAWLEGFPLRTELEHALPGMAVEIEVDSNAAMMAEYLLGSGKRSKRFLSLTCGTGLGVGLAVNGVPVRYAYGCLGDIGHLIVLRDGPRCTCGGRGCAEIMVSAPAVAERYKQASGQSGDLSLRHVIELADGGDKLARAELEAAGGWLGIAIASLSNTFFPDHIAIAGGLSAAGPLVLDPAERVFRESACVLARSSVTFTRATLGSMATLIGAAWPFWSLSRKE
jgi:glucokinase